MSIEQKVIKIVAEGGCLNPKNISATAKFEDIGIDEVDSIEIVMALEEEFGIEIGNEEWGKVISVNEVVELVKGKGGK